MIIKKKTAMFGLDCRALRKQFWELFLASRQSEAPQGANGGCGYFKHGAMFGLDARIALAIFGALSVISGAALFSAIENIKTTAMLTTLNEFEKAYIQYVLDNANNLTDTSSAVHIGNLYSNYNSFTEWKGPYYGTKSTSSTNLQFNLTGVSSVDSALGSYRYSGEFWGPGGGSAVKEQPCTALSCFGYLRMTSSTSSVKSDLTLMAKDLDKLIDNADGPAVGKLRYSEYGVSFSVYYQYFNINYKI